MEYVREVLKQHSGSPAYIAGLYLRVSPHRLPTWRAENELEAREPMPHRRWVAP